VSAISHSWGHKYRSSQNNWHRLMNERRVESQLTQFYTVSVGKRDDDVTFPVIHRICIFVRTMYDWLHAQCHRSPINMERPKNHLQQPSFGYRYLHLIDYISLSITDLGSVAGLVHSESQRVVMEIISITYYVQKRHCRY
jgi:hypothetical protein